MRAAALVPDSRAAVTNWCNNELREAGVVIENLRAV